MNSDAVLRLIGTCKNILKMPYSVGLLRKLAIETVSNLSLQIW